MIEKRDDRHYVVSEKSEKNLVYRIKRVLRLNRGFGRWNTSRTRKEDA
jgi:hypothetical protein